MNLCCWSQAYFASSEEDERKNAGDGSQSHCCSCDASMTILDSGFCLAFIICVWMAWGVCDSGLALFFSCFMVPLAACMIQTKLISLWKYLHNPCARFLNILLVDAELCKVLHTRRKGVCVWRASAALFEPRKGQVCASYCDQNVG